MLLSFALLKNNKDKSVTDALVFGDSTKNYQKSISELQLEFWKVIIWMIAVTVKQYPEMVNFTVTMKQLYLTAAFMIPYAKSNQINHL